MKKSLEFRIARESDLDRILEIHQTSFPDPRGIEERRRHLLHNALGSLDALHVVEHAGTIVGHAFLFALEAWFGGVPAKVGAIASVGVAPEARTFGIGSALLAHLHRESDVRGDAITLLYPFRQGFYVRLGYAPTTSTRRLAIAPQAIPAAWRCALGADRRIRAASGADRGSILAAYARAGARATGWIVRPSALWEARLSNPRRHWFVAGEPGKVRGYVSWSLSQAETHAEVTLSVHDLVADDDDTRRALVGHLGAQVDQVSAIDLEIDAHDPIDRALVDIDRSRFGTQEVAHVLGVSSGGPMVRVLDVARALEARGYPADGGIDLVVSEPEDVAIHLEVREGRGTAGPARGGPSVRVSRAGLAAVLYGALAPSDAARLGWLTAAEPASLGRADELFALPPYFGLDPF